jgi:Hemerythrin HHE cation binding domain
MLRDKSLIPLSHQHQHALALCVRIDRASPIPEADLAAWQGEIAQLFQSEIAIHFVAEEQVLFPAALKFGELRPLLEELRADHAWLRERFSGAGAQTLSANDLTKLAERLSAHIRKEERQLFERLQQWLSRDQLADLGRRLDDALKDAAHACILPTETTRLRGK